MKVVYRNGNKLIVKNADFNDVCKAVYTLTQLVPQGFVVSYGEIARVLGTSPRLVALCLARNKELVVIPCHRVVYSNGNLGGYSSLGVEFKKKLLSLEGVKLTSNGRVPQYYYVSFSWLLTDARS